MRPLWKRTQVVFHVILPVQQLCLVLELRLTGQYLRMLAEQAIQAGPCVSGRGKGDELLRKQAVTRLSSSCWRTRFRLNQVPFAGVEFSCASCLLHVCMSMSKLRPVPFFWCGVSHTSLYLRDIGTSKLGKMIQDMLHKQNNIRDPSFMRHVSAPKVYNLLQSMPFNTVSKTRASHS